MEDTAAREARNDQLQTLKRELVRVDAKAERKRRAVRDRMNLLWDSDPEVQAKRLEAARIAREKKMKREERARNVRPCLGGTIAIMGVIAAVSSMCSAYFWAKSCQGFEDSMPHLFVFSVWLTVSCALAGGGFMLGAHIGIPVEDDDD